MTAILFNLDFSRWDVVLMTFVPACINIGIFIYVLFFLPQNETNYLFSIFVFLIGFWQFGDGLVRMSVTAESALLWYRMSGIFTLFTLPFGILFIFSITRGIEYISNRFVLISLFLPPIIFLLFIIAGLDTYNIIESENWYWIVNPVPDFFTNVIYLWISLGSLIMLALLWHNYLKTVEAKKKQIQILILAVGFTVPVTGGLIAEILFPLILKINTIPLSTPLLTVFSVASLISIKKFNLLEYSPKHKWNQILESMNEGILIVDNDERIMYANKIFCKELGYEFEEIDGKIAREILIDVSDLPQMEKIIEERKNNIFSIYEMPIKSKSGIKLWMEINDSPYTDNAGKIIGSIGIQKNITERKETEIKLNAAKERYDIVAKATSDTIWDLDIVHDRMQYNNGIYAMFGYSIQEVEHLGDWWKEKLHPEDFSNVTTALSEMYEKGLTHLQIEYRFRCADGSYKYIFDRGFLIKNEKGEPIRMIGAMQDITKQKNEENRLKLLESVITNTTDAIVITDIGDENNEMKIIYVNKAYEKMTGYTFEEVIGKNPRILQGPDTDKNELKRLKISMNNFEPCEIEIINYKKNGEAFWTDISLAPVSDSRGNYKHWIGIKRDITEKRKQLFEIEEQNRKLKDIAWTQSHIVRAPLARLMGLIDLFNTDAIDAHEIKEYLNYILKSANELDEVIRSIVLKTITEADKKIE
ncbi:MAG: PAS domain S-box protein [Bacteroidota bacterium]|nr:PAS domain S-box protein [Bacteroidota bacterium]